MIRIIILLNALFFGQDIKAQTQLDTLTYIRLSDISGTAVFEKSILSINDSKAPVKYFISQNCYENVSLVFSSQNETILNSNQLINFFQKANGNDSTTLLVVFYFKGRSDFSSYKVLAGNDKACLAAFKRTLKIDSSFLNSLRKEIYGFNIGYPTLLCKEWKCKTTTLNSIFY